MKNLSKRFLHFGKHFLKQQSMKVRIPFNFPIYNFSQAKSRHQKQSFKNEQNPQRFHEKGNEFQKNYIRLRLHNNSSKPDTNIVHVLINLKVTFPQQGSKQTKITKIQTITQCNQPSIVMVLDKSQFPPQGNLANKEIQRFWDDMIEEQWDMQDVRILSKCEIVGGKTSKRKNIAFTIEINKRSNLTLQNLYQKFDASLKH